MPRSATLVCSWLALFGAVGCAGGRTTVAYEPGRTAEVRPVPSAGYYLLFRTDRTDGKEQVVAQQELERKDAVGFARESDGRLISVAGDTRAPLPEGRYRWGAAPTDERDNRLATAGRWYMAGLEPVGTAIGTAVLAPVVLVMSVFGIYPPFGK